MTSSSTFRAVGISILATLAVACGSSSHDDPAERTASASVALTSVPADAKCIEIDVTGSPSVIKRFDVTPGASVTLPLAALPLGGVDFSGAAFSGRCSDTSAPKTWVTDIVSTVLLPNVVASVTLVFRQQGAAVVGTDFEPPPFRNVTTFAGTLGVRGSADGTGQAARFARPHFLATVGGNLFVSDGTNNTIRQITLATGAVTTIAGTPTPSTSDPHGVDADGVGPAASFGGPEGIASDGAGNLYVADVNAHTIRKIVLATRAVTTIAGVAGVAGSADGIGSAALFNQPFGLTCDGSRLFVVDGIGSTIRQITLATGAVKTIAGAPNVFDSVDGVGSAARFLEAAGITTDGFFLYVGDASTIRRVRISTGEVVTFAGSANVGGAADGFVFDAHFEEVIAIWYDGVSKLYFTDLGNENIRQLDLNTQNVSTLAGALQTPGAADGFGVAAQFNLPVGIASDSAGNIYVSDLENAAIRKL